MTTKPSGAPWADEPFHLIETPSLRLEASEIHVQLASEMAHAHNIILRGLNAIVQQAPWVPDVTSKNYNPQDVKDLLFDTESWVKMVNHHHWVEESFIFPEIERFSGQPGIMENPQHQHELFHAGMQRLLVYAGSTRPEEYRWKGEDEIDHFLGLSDLDSDGLDKTWKKAEAIAKQTGNIGMLYDVFPAALGCADKTYEIGYSFPPLPWIMPYLIKYWFAAGQGAWSFNPCDWWGRPRALAFGPEEIECSN